MINPRIIAAVSENLVIGNKGKIPWYYPEDLAYFKKKTTGNLIIMGSATFYSIGKALPNRVNVVISRSSRKLPNTHVVGSYEAALILSEELGYDRPYIIGGSLVYAAALDDPRVNRAYITHIYGRYEGDRFFPKDLRRDPEWYRINFFPKKEYSFAKYGRRQVVFDQTRKNLPAFAP